jgi:hypothetical protein
LSAGRWPPLEAVASNHHCGREAFLTACDELIEGIATRREHEEPKAEAGMPLGPDTGTDWQEREAWEQ